MELVFAPGNEESGPNQRRVRVPSRILQENVQERVKKSDPSRAPVDVVIADLKKKRVLFSLQTENMEGVDTFVDLAET